MSVTLDQAILRYAEAIDVDAVQAEAELAVCLSDLALDMGTGAVPVADGVALERVDTPASPSEVGAMVPWLRGEAGRRRMRSTVVALGEAVSRLEVSDSALRRVIGETSGADVELLGFKDSAGRWRVFDYQLPIRRGSGGEPSTRVGRRVQRALPPGMHPVALAAWWDAGNPALCLDGQELTPRRWVQAALDPDQVLAAAAHHDAV